LFAFDFSVKNYALNLTELYNENCTNEVMAETPEECFDVKGYMAAHHSPIDLLRLDK